MAGKDAAKVVIESAEGSSFSPGRSSFCAHVCGSEVCRRPESAEKEVAAAK
jgi:hypothetical protein